MRGIVENFVTTAKPGPCTRGLFKVAEGDAGVVLDVIQVCARRKKRGAKIDRLRNKNGDWGGVSGGHDSDDERDRDLDEAQQSGVLYGGGSDRWATACSILLSAVDEHADVAGPVDF